MEHRSFLKQKLIVFILVIVNSFYCVALFGAKNVMVASPDGAVTVSVGVEDHRPYYSVKYKNNIIVNPSRLGFILSNGTIGEDVAIESVKRNSVDETWQQVWGEDKDVRNNYNEICVTFKERKNGSMRMQVVFRAFNDGIGFRYIVSSKVKSNCVLEELTEVSLAHDAKAWSIPSNRTSYFEGIFKSDMLSQKDTVCTPLTIEYADSIYLSLHEAALEDYASLNYTPRPSKNGGICLLAALTPWQDGVKVRFSDKLCSPWRTIIISPTAGGLITSRLMLNLNEPSRIKDTSWIEPGRYIGIWWSIHKKSNTWEMGPTHGATTENVKRYMDFAARHGFSGVLAEGWNPGWKEGERVTYLKSYPDFDIDEVCRYGKEKGVCFIGHMESWGRASLIEQEMDSAFAWFNKLGIRVVKTGYVGRLFDGKELPKSQYGIRHYRKVIECAARHQIMIDNHEPAMPTGIQRTWPNLMTQEGVRGQEYNAWDVNGGNPPSHTVTLPFTRGLAGPMDFTPAIFNFSEVVKGTHPHSTLAKQLSEFVVLYSPLQMAADAIENYEGQPALTFIESCPTTWSKTLVPHGVIGKYITVVRKERDGDRWFIGSMTNEEPRDLKLNLDFLDKDVSYKAVIYEDGVDAHYESNPYPMQIRQLEVKSNDIIDLHLAPGGGTAIRIEKTK